jgi:hypothetical protein
MFCRHRERTRIEDYLCFCRCLWPEKKVKSDIDVARDDLGRVSFKDFLEDDGSFVGLFDRPVRVGASILLYGRRDGRWPSHCMAGPDWPGSLLVYFLIIMVHSVVLGLCSTCLGWAVQVAGWIGCIALLVSYTAVAFTNPGMVYKEVKTLELDEVSSALAVEEGKAGIGCDGGTGDESASEDSTSASTKQLIAASETGSKSAPTAAGHTVTGQTTTRTATVAPAVPAGIRQVTGVPPPERKVPCGRCEIDRPMQARHCEHCGACIRNIDHHCPWSGKCIAENNMRQFNWFLGVLCFEMYFMLGTFIYYWVACYTNSDAPRGDGASEATAD